MLISASTSVRADVEHVAVPLLLDGGTVAVAVLLDDEHAAEHTGAGEQQRQHEEADVQTTPATGLAHGFLGHWLTTGPTRSHFHASPPRIDRLP